MKIWNAALACGALAVGAVVGAHPAAAQGTTFPDVPANHWAYQAVQDLADKGYVKGYPDGKFLGKRDLTRYEFATVLDRIVQTVNDLNTKVGAIPTTPTGAYVTQDDLNKVQALVDSFRAQLDTIQSNVTNLTDQLDALRQDVLDTKAIANKAQDTANNSYGVGSTRKFAISGYVQARAVFANSGSKSRFPQGSNTVAGAYNGNYAQGGVQDSLEVRRARLKFTGTLNQNSKYGVQFDVSGAVSSGAVATQQVTTKEAYVTYTTGNGDQTKYPSITAGQFANPFGYALGTSMALQITPERPLAFSEGNNLGLWDSQDYDKGVQLSYNPSQQLLFLPTGIKLSYTLFNGTGRNSENSDNHFDSVYRVAYSSGDKRFNLGTSYYDGFAARSRPAGIPAAQLTYQAPKKQLFGLDGQVQLPSGVFVNGEFVKGKYEKRSYFNESLTTAANPFGGDSLQTDTYVKGNQVQGYYVQGGYTFGMTGNHPLTLAINYDKFLRSHSAQVGTGTGSVNALQSDATFDDVNLGYGALYNLDKATRLRLWYDHPIEVAHAPGTPQPPRIGLFTTELQVKF